MKKTRQALLLSALSLLVCFAMLVGTTFAWFTDSVSSVNNIITSGNLDVELYWAVPNADGVIDESDWTLVDKNTDVFADADLWEPGHVEVAYFTLKNVGSLALKWDLSVNVYDEIGSINAFGEDFLLSDYIKADVVELSDGEVYATRADARDAVSTEMGLYGETESGVLTSGESKYMALIVYMPETVGNEANHMTDEAVPTINLGINLFATQTPYEADSFGIDYDANATYDDGSTGDGSEGGEGGSEGEGGNEEEVTDIRVLGTGGYRGVNWNDAENGWNIREYLALPFDVEDPNMGTITIQPAQGTTPSVPNGQIYSGDVSGTTMTGPVTSIGDAAATETSDILWEGVTEITVNSGNLAIMHRTLPIGTVVNVQADTTLNGTQSTAFGADASYDGTLVTFRVACDEADLEASAFYASLETLFGGSIPSCVVIEAVGA